MQLLFISDEDGDDDDVGDDDDEDDDWNVNKTSNSSREANKP